MSWRMLLEVFDGRGIDQLRERETLIESVALKTINGRRDEVDSFADLNRPRTLALHEGSRRNGATR
jgi:hypothetical protein